MSDERCRSSLGLGRVSVCGLTRASVELLLWQNNLNARHIVGAWNWVVHDADSADDFSNNFCPFKFLYVRRIANYQRGSGCLLARSNTCYLPMFIEQNFIYGRV
jgi:hypothetical protein